MKNKLKKKINDGDLTGLKQDRFRNSDFEYDTRFDHPASNEMTHKSINTMGGAYADNRGRRNASEKVAKRDDNPFVSGRIYNWNHRKGWDRYFDSSYDKDGNRPHGGALIGHDPGGHTGKGPKGYKRSDERIKEDVSETLALSPDINTSEIEVSVEDGCVFLNGMVDSRETKRMAELAIENISGVFDVQNLLSFRNDTHV